MGDQGLHFTFGHLEGQGDISFLSNGDLVSCGVDGLLKIWKIENGSVTLQQDIDQDVNHPVLRVIPVKDKLISFSDDCSVVEHCYDTESKEWKAGATLVKTTSKAKSVSYFPESEELIVGLEEGKMVSISIKDNSQSPFLPNHPSSVLNIQRKLNSHILATYCSDGCIRIWDIKTRKVISTEILVPSFASDVHGEFLGLSWSPDGKHIGATSGLKGECSVYSVDDKYNLSKQTTLQNNDQSLVSQVSFSHDGNFICSASCEGEIILFSLKGENVQETAHDGPLYQSRWNKNSSTRYQLLFLDSQGQIGIWDNCIPCHLVSKLKEQPAVVDEDDITVRKNRLATLSTPTKVEDVEMEDEPSKVEELTTKEQDSFTMDPIEDEFNFNPYSSKSTPKTPMQESFQVGCAMEHKSKQCLHWSLSGYIVSSKSDDGNQYIETTLTDSSKTKPKRLIDRFGFDKAAIGEFGTIFSSEVNEVSPATVFYRPFDSWTSNSEWRIQLDYSEEITGISIGTKFVSVSTDNGNVKILTLSGIQYGLFSIPGPFVCSAASGNQLAVVYHRSEPFNNNQSLGFLIYNFDENCVTLQQDLCLSPRSNIHWVGWDESGNLLSVDDSGLVQTFVTSSRPVLRNGSLHSATQSTGMWTPVATLINDQDLFHWVIGCTKEQVIFTKCTAGDKSPIFLPSYTPPLHSVPYSPPLLPQTPDSEKNLFISRIQLQSTDEPRDRMRMQQALDKSLLRLFHSSCNEDKLQRALDYAHLLTFPKAVDIATQVASSANIRSLVKHLEQLKEAVLLQSTLPEPERTPLEATKPTETEQTPQVEPVQVEQEKEEPMELEDSESEIELQQKPKSKKPTLSKKPINPFKKTAPAKKKGQFVLDDLEEKTVGSKRKGTKPSPSSSTTKKRQKKLK